MSSSRQAACLAALLAACCAANEPGPRPAAAPATGPFELFVLGTAQDGGLPHLGCVEACCVAARRDGTVRYPACLAIHDRGSGALVLIEATPAIEPQLALLYALTGRQRGKAHPVDAVLLTHAHIGHYLGLAQFGREVADTKHLPLFVSPRMADFLAHNGPWDQLVALDEVRLHRFEAGKPFAPIPGLSVTAVVVPHRDEYSDTVAFKIRGPEATVLFCPDTDGWSRHPGLLDDLLDGVDRAYLDGTFWDGSELPGRDLSEIPHPPIVRTMELLAEDGRQRPGRIRFLHLNHTNPVLRDARLRADLEARGFRLAREGERFRL